MQAFVDKFGIQVQTPDWLQGTPRVFRGLGNYAEVMVEGQPGSIKLRATLPRANPELLHIMFYGTSYEAQNNYRHLLTSSKPFENPIPIWDWNKEGKPDIRQEPFDNFRDLIIRKTGRFTLIEIGLVWRPNGRFYRTSQILYEGRLTTLGRKGVFVIPADSKSARPGLDFSRQWAEIDTALPGIVEDQNITIPRDTKPAAWNPGPPPAKRDDEDLIVVNFNSWVAEQGGAMDQEGVRIFQETGNIPSRDHFLFLHANAIEGDDPIKVVPLATWLKAKVGEKLNPGHRFRPVLSCKPA